jgi:hypothetical protein
LAKADQILSDKEKKPEKQDQEATTTPEVKKTTEQSEEAQLSWGESNLGNPLVNLHLKAQEMILDD